MVKKSDLVVWDAEDIDIDELPLKDEQISPNKGLHVLCYKQGMLSSVFDYNMINTIKKMAQDMGIRCKETSGEDEFIFSSTSEATLEQFRQYINHLVF